MSVSEATTEKVARLASQVPTIEGGECPSEPPIGGRNGHSPSKARCAAVGCCCEVAVARGRLDPEEGRTSRAEPGKGSGSVPASRSAGSRRTPSTTRPPSSSRFAPSSRPLRVVALHRALVARRRRRVAAARVGLDELLALRAVGGRSAVARRIRHALAGRGRVLPAGTTRSHLAARGRRRGGPERPVLRALLGSLREPARVAGGARLLEGAGASACEGGLQRGPAGRPSVLLRIAARVPDLVAGERGDHDRRHDERTECGRARWRHGPPPFAPREEAALNALS